MLIDLNCSPRLRSHFLCSAKSRLPIRLFVFSKITSSNSGFVFSKITSSNLGSKFRSGTQKPSFAGPRMCAPEHTEYSALHLKVQNHVFKLCFFVIKVQKHSRTQQSATKHRQIQQNTAKHSNTQQNTRKHCTIQHKTAKRNKLYRRRLQNM